MFCTFVFLFLALSGAGLCSLQDRQTDFGLRVFSQMVQSSRGKNLAFSPYGVTSVLGMAQLGAGGNTQRMLTKKMGFSLRERGMSREQRLLQRDVTSEEGVEAVSGVMVERKMSLEKGFRRGLAKAYHTEPHQVDFRRPEQARRVINAWVSDHTADAIPEFLAADALMEESRLVLLNAIHFQGLWKVPFDPENTQERMFRCGNGSSVSVPMMHLTNRFQFGEFVSADGLDYDVIEVPYEGDSLSMLLVLPFEPETPVSALTKELSSQRIQQWREEFRTVKRQLSLPRFTLESDLDLKPILTNMGMGDMFNLATADFSRITTEERLSMSKVLQKVKIEVNEEGTKGSAATSAILFSRMAVEEYCLDRPFLFLIQQKSTGAVLFMGEVNQP